MFIYAGVILILLIVLLFFVDELRTRHQTQTLKVFLISLPAAVLISCLVDQVGQTYLDYPTIVLEATIYEDSEAVDLFFRENQTFKLVDHNIFGSSTSYYGYYEPTADGYMLTNCIPGAGLGRIENIFTLTEAGLQYHRTYSERDRFEYTLRIIRTDREIVRE